MAKIVQQTGNRKITELTNVKYR